MVRQVPDISACNLAKTIAKKKSSAKEQKNQNGGSLTTRHGWGVVNRGSALDGYASTLNSPENGERNKVTKATDGAGR